MVQLHEAHELEDAGVRVELGTEVAGVDLANRSLVTSAHQTFDFSELVIATGVRARSLPDLVHMAARLGLESGTAAPT